MKRDGVVEATLPSGLFKIRTEDGKVVTATLSPKARRVTVKVIPGDRVTVELSPIDPSRGRVTKRHR